MNSLETKRDGPPRPSSVGQVSGGTGMPEWERPDKISY